ncbi:MAG: ribosome small subunit-dependent GTPase A [Bacillota bacterium]|nr:ribosome small subunit-dependent GTPase A [Bacillota bacterium]
MRGTEVLTCRLRGRLAREVEKSDGALVVVGDRVQVETLPDGSGIIEEVLPRRSAVARKAAGRIPREQVLAANVDLAAVVVSLREPRFKPGTVMQFVLGARAGGVEPLVVLNKVDLDCGNLAQAEEALAPVRAAGVCCVATSAKNGDGLEDLAGCLRGCWTLFYGQSGVGKSSLLNRLCPEAAARTSAVSHVTGRGRHTTSGSTLYALPEGGFVIDTPGVRSFSFWNAPEREDVAGLFPEIEALAGMCRFRDCAHDREPGCAVREALDRGEIDARRYRHYVRLARGARRHGWRHR